MQIQNKEFLDRFVKELILNSIRKEITEAEERYYEELKGVIDREKISFEKIKEIEEKEKAMGEETKKMKEMLPSLAPEKDMFKMAVQNRPREIIEILTTTEEVKAPEKMGPGTQKKFSMPLEKIEAQKPLIRSILPFPVPLEKIAEIDLGKINPVISDPTVKAIECPGPEKFIFVHGVLGSKQANIRLSEEEISYIINKFSEKTRIPVIRGIFRAISENLTISAVISELAGSRFIIKKIQKQETWG